MTRDYLENIKKTKVAFNQLQRYFCNNPVEYPLFKSSDDFKTWLNLGLKCRIFNEVQVQHHKNPS